MISRAPATSTPARIAADRPKVSIAGSGKRPCACDGTADSASWAQATSKSRAARSATVSKMGSGNVRCS